MKLDLGWQEWKAIVRLAKLGLKSMGPKWTYDDRYVIAELEAQLKKVVG